MKLALNLSSFSDDNVQAELEGGLLKLVHATATDRTGDVLTEIGRAAGTFRGTAVTSTSQAMQFDPFSEKDSLQFNRWLKSYLPGSCVAVEISPSHWSPGCEQYTGKRAKAYASSKSPRYAAEITAAASKPGIYYRQATPRRVLVVKDKKPYEIKYVAFANDAPPEELQMERGSLITRDTKASFSGGELQSITIKKDSEALAAAKLPVAIFKAYVGGMVDAVTQQSEYEKARADYITAQANRLKAETSLIKETGQLPIGGFNSSEFRTSGGGFRSSGPTDDLCRSFLRQDIQHPCAQIPR